MARTVQEIMNRELLAVGPALPAADARALLCSFAVGAAPVLDAGRRPVGSIRLRDLVDRGGVVEDHMSRPALCVDASAEVDAAARILAGSDWHQLVVVDAGGEALGVVAVLDVLRALVGAPACHPRTFPHWDEATKTSWTDDRRLDEGGAAQAPNGPGVLALVRDAPSGRAGAVVWVESCGNVRERLRDVVRSCAAEKLATARPAATTGELRFRAASVPRADERERIVALLRDWVDHAPPPGGT